VEKNVEASWKAVKKHPLRFFSIILLDLLFLFLFIGVTFVLVTQLYDHIITLFTRMQELTGGLLNNIEQFPNFDALWRDAQIQESFNQVLIRIVLSILSMAIIFAFLQGLSWYQSQKLFKRIQLRAYLATFINKTFITFGLFFILALAAAKTLLTSSFSLNPVIRPELVLGVFNISLGVLWYFAILSFTQRGKTWQDIKKAVFFGTKGIKHIAGELVVIIIVGLLLNYAVLPSIYSLNNLAGMIFGLLLFLPYIAFSRILLIKAMN
jgi:hypothetical protein